jgi:hypothetical protein
MGDCFDYVAKNGIEAESTYPYVETAGQCYFNLAKSVGKCVGPVYLPQGDEAALQNAVANIGPVSVAIDASQPSFEFYKGGIYDEPNCTQEADHAGELRSFNI